MMTIGQTTPHRSNPETTGAPELSSREVLVDRYCELQPQMQRRFSAILQRELRDELQAVTGHQLSVLTYLRGQSVTMRELARELAVGESAATAVVDRLVRQGLVVRCDDPSDDQLAQLVATMEMLDAAAIANEALAGCESAAQDNAQEEPAR